MRFEKLKVPARGRGALRVLLVKASDPRPYKESHDPTAPPLGILYISAALKKWLGHPVETKFLAMDFKRSTHEDFYAVLEDFKPHIVGLSAVTAESPTAIKMAELTKRYDPTIPVILGGPHATVYPQVAQEPNIDFAVLGEGDRTIIDLVHCLMAGDDVSKVPGIAYKDESGRVMITGKRQFIPNLDELPYPDWDIMDIAWYQDIDNWISFRSKSRWYMNISTSRGCPYRCIYCHNIFGKYTRFRSPENVLGEILTLYDKYNIREIMIVDDIFNLDASRMMKILDMIVNKYKLDLRLTFPNGVRGDILTFEQLDMLFAAGTYYMSFAVESGSPRIQKLMKKNLNIPKIIENIKYASNLGIIINAFFMLGFPTETKEDMMETLRIASMPEIDLCNFFVTIPQYGTELHELAKQIGVLPQGVGFDVFKYHNTPINCSAVPDDEFEQIKKLAEKIIIEKKPHGRLGDKVKQWQLLTERNVASYSPMKALDEKKIEFIKKIERRLAKLQEQSYHIGKFAIQGLGREEDIISFELSSGPHLLHVKLVPKDSAPAPLLQTSRFDIVVSEKRPLLTEEKKALLMWKELIKKMEQRLISSQ